jgi:Transposase DDE domain
LRSVRPASLGCRVADSRDRNPSGQARTHALPGRPADAAFYSTTNEAAAKAKGVKRVCVPNRATKNAARKREQKKRWFRNGQKWRTGCEGRISVAKRRHGLNRCRYKGESGTRRWVGLGVIADNVINIGRSIAKQTKLE